jgi:hypothetical protein
VTTNQHLELGQIPLSFHFFEGLRLLQHTDMDSHRPGETLIFDNFDVDLLVKVLENTAFSASLL